MDDYMTDEARLLKSIDERLERVESALDEFKSLGLSQLEGIKNSQIGRMLGLK